MNSARLLVLAVLCIFYSCGRADSFYPLPTNFNFNAPTTTVNLTLVANNTQGAGLALIIGGSTPVAVSGTTYTLGAATGVVNVIISFNNNGHWYTAHFGLSAGTFTVPFSGQIIPINWLYIDMCTGKRGNTSVSFTGSPSVAYTLNVCADYISIPSISQNTTQNVMSFTSNVNMNIGFKNPYSGTYTASYPTAPAKITGPLCRTTSSTSQGAAGSCRFADSVSYSKTSFYALAKSGDMSINFGACAAATLAEPIAMDVTPANNFSPYATSAKAYDIRFDDKMVYTNYVPTTGVSRLGAMPVGPDGGIECSQGVFSNAGMQLILNASLPALYKGVQYTVTMAYRQNNTRHAMNFTGYVVYQRDYVNGNFYHGSLENVVANLVATPSVNTTTATWINIVYTFTVSVDFPQFTHLVFLTDVILTSGIYTSFYFKDLMFHVPSLPITVPSLLQKDSQLVTLPKMNPAFDPNPRGSACAHLQTGLKLWHDPNTWPSRVVPLPSSDITLPANTKILASGCSFSSAIYKSITIPVGSALVFDDAPINLHIRYMSVLGNLTIGGEQCRLFSEVSITFHGDKWVSAGVLNTQKGIVGAPSSVIDIHGKQYHATWSRLAATADAGSDRVYLMDNVNWEVGQQVVVVTTIIKDEVDPQNEIMTIAAISGRTVVFTQPLTFQHYGGQEYQAEVGLLTRRIKLMGADDSEVDMFGGQVKALGVARYSGVQTWRMGQLNQVGNYPLHFHMGGVKPLNFIRDCTFWHSYFRCLSIHGTHNTTVTRNVAFDIYGHCYYIEDGVEENNTLSFNLATNVHTIYSHGDCGGEDGCVYTTIPDVLHLPADVAASGFYITNAHNYFIGNAAAGGFSGFAFPNLDEPLGLSWNSTWIGNKPMDPSGRPPIVFDGNSCHSSGYWFRTFGACIYISGHLTMNSSTLVYSYKTGRYGRYTRNQQPGEGASSSGAIPMIFTNTKVFLSQGGVAHWGYDGELHGFESYDNTFGHFGFNTHITNALIVGRTTRDIKIGGTCAFSLYDATQILILTNITFANFNPGVPGDDNYIFKPISQSDTYHAYGMWTTARIKYQNVTFTHVVGLANVDTKEARSVNIKDSDGSLTRTGVPSIAGAYSNTSFWNVDRTCVLQPGWNMWVCQKKTREVVWLNLQMKGVTDCPNSNIYGTSKNFSHIGEIDLWGTGITDRRLTYVTANAGTVGLAGTGWFFNLTAGSPTYLYINPITLPFSQAVYLAMAYPAGTTFNITYRQTYRNSTVTLGSSIADVVAGKGLVYYWDNTHLYVKIMNIADTNAGRTGTFMRDDTFVYTWNSGPEYYITAHCGAHEFTYNNYTYCPNSKLAPRQPLDVSY